MIASRINFLHTSVLRFMSYSDFTIEKVNQDFHLRVTATAFLGEVEAKQGDLNSGWGQCIAEMVAAQKFNELSETTISAVYGVVTNGTLWQFLRLQGDRVAIEPQEYPLMPVANILGILRQMIGT
jgi:hypothetical protein